MSLGGPVDLESPGAELEITALTSLLPGARLVRSPTRAQVLDALPVLRLVHFACHAHANRLQPARSHLILADHATAPLTVADLVHLDVDADLAYLSACRTSVTAPQLADMAPPEHEDEFLGYITAAYDPKAIGSSSVSTEASLITAPSKGRSPFLDDFAGADPSGGHASTTTEMQVGPLNGSPAQMYRIMSYGSCALSLRKGK